ncbi:S1-like domain-containing RNA-binding protein [Marinilabiliaceae bacterium ANBcel2]|nr:S1-like domain-containing RNA-binding protein [Marinilabiliaceae bacterium ANBcel2]
MAVEIGRNNSLSVLRETSVGLFLDGDTLGDILLPNRYVTEEMVVGEEVDVFVYLDSEDRLVATTEKPYAQTGEFAFLEVIAVSRFGAFLDWGLMKDLLVPFREQAEKMERGRSYLVYLYLDDESKRIVASSKISRYLDNVSPPYSIGEKVDLIIAGKTELGYKAVINNSHSGILYFNQVFKELKIGDRLPGYINKIREDDKIDLLLEKPGYEKIDYISELILEKLNSSDGFLPLNDKSSPEEIQSILSISKKNFKKSLGALYKRRIVEIKENGIYLYR